MYDYQKYKELCDEILKIDDHIRYVGINKPSLFVSRLRKGEQKLLTEAEQKEFLSNEITMSDFNRQLIAKLGNEIYSMTVYNKIIRLNIPFFGKNLLIITIDSTESYPEIVDNILKFKTRHF